MEEERPANEEAAGSNCLDPFGWEEKGGKKEKSIADKSANGSPYAATTLVRVQMATRVRVAWRPSLNAALSALPVSV